MGYCLWNERGILRMPQALSSSPWNPPKWVTNSSLSWRRRSGFIGSLDTGFREYDLLGLIESSSWMIFAARWRCWHLDSEALPRRVQAVAERLKTAEKE